MEPILLAIYLITVVVVFVFMEGFAWFLHKYVMHGFLWVLHKDHHIPKGGRFQKNDIFSLFFSALAFVFILVGLLLGFNIYFWIGVGVTMYGIGYFMVHDIFFHKRIKIKYKPKSDYVKRILKAHGVHHMRITKEKGVNFGFIYSSKNYAKAPIS
jgi:beta-carotene 3-hydroxylase